MDDPKKSSSRIKIILALIPVIGAIILALIKLYLISKTDKLTFSGTVIDNGGNAVKMAKIQIVGKNESFITEDNGNFTFQVPINKDSKDNSIRVIIARDGYTPLDESFALPTEETVIQLEKNK